MSSTVNQAAAVDVLDVLRRTASRLRDPQRLSRTAQGKEAYAADLDAAHEAIAELIAADREFDAANDEYRALLLGGSENRLRDADARLTATVARRAAALNRLGGAK